MKIYLQYWRLGKLIINFELQNVNKNWTINDLIYKYWLEIIKPVHSSFTFEYCNSKMDLIKYRNGNQYSKNKKLKYCNIIDGEAFSVLSDFSY